MTTPRLLNSITDTADEDRDTVAVTGSHGGIYAAYLASRAGIRACIFNDAGRGLDDAGIAGMLALGNVGMAAAAIDCRTARIGDAEDMLKRGIVSTANEPAQDLGLVSGMTCQAAIDLLEGASTPHEHLPSIEEARRVIDQPGRPDIVLADSASLVRPDADAGRIVITGSHGGLIGGDPARAIKTDAMVAVFNDAGIGADDAGVTRLPALDQREIASVTVAHTSARIGDAASAWETGVISQANGRAASLSAKLGGSLKAWVDSISPDGR